MSKRSKFWDIRQQAGSPNTLDMYIYSDVEDDYYNWWGGHIKSETSANHFRDALLAHGSVSQINLYINSLGGSVKEGLGILNQLKRHPAHVTAYIDGFAFSVASLIAMSADEIVMPKNTLMLLHNVWITASGNSAELRKAADDLEQYNEATKQAYLEKAGGKLDYETLTDLMNAESTLTAEQCMQYGLCDRYAEEEADISAANQLLQMVKEKSVQQYQKGLEKVVALANTTMTEPMPTKIKVDIDTNVLVDTVVNTIKKYF